MSEAEYHSSSTDLFIAIFAINSAIIFCFLIIFLCCLCKCCGSGRKSSIDKTKFNEMFELEKYSSESNISSVITQKVFKTNDEKITKTKTNSNNKCFMWILSCFSKSTSDKKINESPNPKSSLEKLEEGHKEKTNISLDTTNENLQINKESTNIEEKENKESTNIEEKENKESTNIEEKENKESTNIEEKENKESTNKKIYIVWEFNNLDKQTQNYYKNSQLSEFEMLEEFVNYVIKTFPNKYSQIEIILKISSPGGYAYEFEHAYLNLMRLRKKGVSITGLVDKIAASGGYMLASACNKIVCSKYAIIGSIGVIAQLHNWSGLSKKIGLEEKTFTTGSHKNPFPIGSDYDEADVERMNENIQNTFTVFKNIVSESRKFTPEQLEQIYMAKTFYGYKALELNMVDQISLSTDYLDDLVLNKYDVWICKADLNSDSFDWKSLLGKNLKYSIKFFTKFIKNSIKMSLDDDDNFNYDKYNEFEIKDNHLKKIKLVYFFIFYI